jgi:hypothetical protein
MWRSCHKKENAEGGLLAVALADADVFSLTSDQMKSKHTSRVYTAMTSYEAHQCGNRGGWCILQVTALNCPKYEPPVHASNLSIVNITGH